MAYYLDDGTESYVLEVWPVGIPNEDQPEGNGHFQTDQGLLYELAEFDSSDAMKFVHAISINAPTRNVWDSLSSPDVWPSIWGRAGRIQQVSHECVEVGAVYEMELQCGSRTTSVRYAIVGVWHGSQLREAAGRVHLRSHQRSPQ